MTAQERSGSPDYGTADSPTERLLHRHCTVTEQSAIGPLEPFPLTGGFQDQGGIPRVV